MMPLDIVEARFREAVTAAPYFDVVNINVDMEALPDVWAGMIYLPESTVDRTMGSTPMVEESGVFSVGLFAKSGVGPRALDAAVQQVRTAFHGWQSGELRIDRVDGPLDTAPQADGNIWQLALTLAYSRWYRRDATGAGFGDDKGIAHMVGSGEAAGASLAVAGGLS